MRGRSSANNFAATIHAGPTLLEGSATFDPNFNPARLPHGRRRRRAPRLRVRLRPRARRTDRKRPSRQRRPWTACGSWPAALAVVGRSKNAYSSPLDAGDTEAERGGRPGEPLPERHFRKHSPSPRCAGGAADRQLHLLVPPASALRPPEPQPSRCALVVGARRSVRRARRGDPPTGATRSPGVAPTIDRGDTAWMLVCTMAVLLMVPGLGLFEAGLLRAKNSVSVLMQCFAGLALLSVLWFLCGFSLCFSETDLGLVGGRDVASPASAYRRSPPLRPSPACSSSPSRACLPPSPRALSAFEGSAHLASSCGR